MTGHPHTIVASATTLFLRGIRPIMTRTDALTSGTKLGPYEIQAPLGAGGMGEVYRARDTRLERAVAIKILSAHLCQNAEARDRFDHEARAISSLSHPNICHLYDVGQQDGISYVVMEYLEGPPAAGAGLKSGSRELRRT